MACRPPRPLNDGEPSPSSPYYLFGIQKRYPFQWSGAAGGVLPPARAHGLGNADLYESGYGDPMYEPYPPLQRTILHRGLGDWPLVRPAGPEPWVLGMSDSEKQYALIAAAGFAAWWLFFRKSKRRGRRRNPSARGYYVASSTRGVAGRLFFKKKGDASWYAKLLRSQGKRARILKA